MTDEQKLLPVLPSQRQLFFAKMGYFVKESNCSDLYHVDEAVELLRANIGDEPLKEKFKENYPNVINYLSQMRVRLNKVKMYYDSIKNVDERIKEQRIKELFNRQFIKMPLIGYRLLFKSLVTLINRSELRFMPVPHEYIKRMEKEHKVLGEEKSEQEQHGEGAL